MKLNGCYLPYFWLALCAWICREAACLQCYQCNFENTLEGCMQTEETCGNQQVCMNTVFRRPLLGVVYTKGCKDRSDCFSLQDLNENRYCQSSPSECVYCCDSDLCNDANHVRTSYSTMFFLVISTGTYIVLR